jgi:protein tyrosine phosphatase
MQNTLWRCLVLTAVLISGFLGALSDERRLESFETLVAKNTHAIPKDLLQWLDSQTIPLEPSAITGNYEQIKSMVGKISKYIQKPLSTYCRGENHSKNAFLGIPIFVEKRTPQPIGSPYVNVNEVLTPLQEYIVGQAPHETMVSDFWRLLLEARASTIIALCMPSDTGGRRPSYWETSQFPCTISGWKIQQQGSGEVLDTSLAIPSQRIVKRVFEATHEGSGETRTITHIHYENWPDDEAPEPLLFYRFIHLVSKIHPMSSSPLFVHCAAGIGRSGTFVAAHSLCKEIEAFHPLTINIPKRIVELRMQRANLVSSTVQFGAIYEAVNLLSSLDR